MAAGMFQQGWSAVAFGPYASTVQRKFVRTLLEAHERLANAHVEAGLKTNHVYGNVFRKVYERLIEEFAEDIARDEHVNVVTVRGYGFLVIYGWLIYPIRYAKSYKDPHGAKIAVSQLRQAVLTRLGADNPQATLGPAVEDLEAEEAGDEPTLPEVLAALGNELRVAVLAFTSNPTAGILQASIGHPELNGDRLEYHGRIETLDISKPPASEDGGTFQGKPHGSGPIPSSPRFGQGTEPDVPIVPKARPATPPTELEQPTPNIQNDE